MELIESITTIQGLGEETQYYRQSFNSSDNIVDLYYNGRLIGTVTYLEFEEIKKNVGVFNYIDGLVNGTD